MTFLVFLQNNVFLFFLFALITIAFGWIFFLFLSLRKIRQKSEHFFSGGKNENLEDLLVSHSKNLKILDKDIQELYEISNKINALAFRGYHKMGIVRFNPFKEVGGDQSFSIALLDGKNNGLTISSLYGRGGTRFYAKSITNGQAEKHPLTKEEEMAIKLAAKEKN